MKLNYTQELAKEISNTMLVQLEAFTELARLKKDINPDSADEFDALMRKVIDQAYETNKKALVLHNFNF